MISMFFASLFRVLLLHQFSKDFETDFGLFSMCVWYLFCLRTQLFKFSKTFVFTMNLHFFAYQKIMICDDLCDLFRYLFWHWFLINLDIDFASILAPVWYQVPCLFGDRFTYFCCMFCLSIWKPNLVQGVVWDALLFIPFSTSFRRFCFWRFLSSLWLPFGSLLVTFWLNVGRSGYPFCSIVNLFNTKMFSFVTQSCKAFVDQPHTLSSKELLLCTASSPTEPGAEPAQREPWENISLSSYICIYTYIYIYIYVYVSINIWGRGEGGGGSCGKGFPHGWFLASAARFWIPGLYIIC